MQKSISSVELLLSDARGVYIPRDFATGFDMAAWHVKPDDAEILANPDHEWYWEAWNDVLNYAYYIDNEGNKYHLMQDGDLWAYCYELMTDKEKHNFGFED